MYFVISDHFSAACTYSDQRWTIDTPTIEVVGFLLHFIGAHLFVSMGVSKQLLCHERATGHLSWRFRRYLLWAGLGDSAAMYLLLPNEPCAFQLLKWWLLVCPRIKFGASARPISINDSNGLPQVGGEVSARQSSAAPAAGTPLPPRITKDHCQRKDNDCQSESKQNLKCRIGLREMCPEVDNQANKNYDT